MNPRKNVMSRWNVVALAATAALVGLTVALPASAQWKWKDKAGQTQYSDLPPPPGIAEQDILQRPAGGRRAAAPSPLAAASAASGALVATPRAGDPELEARRKKVDQDAADKQKAEDAKTAVLKADNCARARQQARTIESGVRMARTNDKGEREFMDDAARAAEARKAQDVIASDCK